METAKPLYEQVLRNLGEDEISLMRRVISNYTFIDYGIVQEYNSGIIKVKLAHKMLDEDVELINIEVLTLGSKALSIQHELVQGDVVQLVSSKSLVDSVAELTKASISTCSPYDTSTIKAIPLANFANAKNKLTITQDGAYKIEGTDYSIEVTTDGTIKVIGNALELNGNGKRFVLWEDFNTAYQNLITWLNTHIHNTSGSGGPSSAPTVSVTSDISSAKTTTLKTNG